MAGRLIIDVHMHIRKSREQGIRQKGSYEIWEYGEKADTYFCDSTGTVEEAVEAMERAGFSRAVVVNLFAAFRVRDDAGAELPRDMAPSEREEAMRKVEAAMGESLKEFNLWACDLAAPHPQLIPYIAGDPSPLRSDEQVAHTRDMVGNHGARGIKVHPVLQQFHMSDRRMWPVYETGQELGIPVLSNSGPARGPTQYAEPRAFADALSAFPNLTLVLAHLGGGAWEQALEIAEAYPNAYFDCCEVIEWTGAPNAPSDMQMAQLIKDIGPARVMMGSDFPTYDLDHSVERVMELPVLSDEEKEAILGANAARILGV